MTITVTGAAGFNNGDSRAYAGDGVTQGTLAINAGAGEYLLYRTNEVDVGAQNGFSTELTLNGANGGSADLKVHRDDYANDDMVEIGVGLQQRGTIAVTGDAQLIIDASTNYDAYYGEQENASGFYGRHLSVGTSYQAYGGIQIDGAGASIDLVGDGGRAQFGGGSSAFGLLNIANGGAFNGQLLHLGAYNNATGLAFLNEGATLSLNGDQDATGADQIGLAIGYGANGTLTAINSAISVTRSAGETTDSYIRAPYVDVGRFGTGGLYLSNSTLTIADELVNGGPERGKTELVIGAGDEANAQFTAGSVVSVTGDQASVKVGAGDLFNVNYGAVAPTANLRLDNSSITVTGLDAAFEVGLTEGTAGDVTLTSSASVTVESGGFGPASAAIGAFGDGQLIVASGSSFQVSSQGLPAILTIGSGNVERFGTYSSYGYSRTFEAEANGEVFVDGYGSQIIIGDPESYGYGYGPGGYGPGPALFIGETEDATGLLVISDEASVILPEANSVVVVAGAEGSEGTLALVEGETGAGGLLTVSGDIFVSTAVTPDFDTGGLITDINAGGEGVVLIEDGARLSAGNMLVGVNGSLSIAGIQSVDLTVHGEFFIDANGSDSVNLRSLEVGQFARWLIDIEDLETNVGDFASAVGDVTVDSRRSLTAIDLDPANEVQIGDTFVVARAMHGIVDVETKTIFDINRGIAFEMRADVTGQEIHLVALEDAAAAATVITGTEQADTLQGDNLRELIQGLGGADSLLGGDAGDTIEGGEGNDTLEGEGGNDRLFGGIGDDSLVGGAGSNELIGGAGADTLDGTGSDFTIASYEDADRRVQADLSGRVAGVNDAAGDVFIAINLLEGSRFNDNLFGSDVADIIAGGDQTDRLFGRSGDDFLIGGRGTDLLIGNQGVDQMEGQEGRDRFVFFNMCETGVGVGLRDVILDFTQADNDRIEISRFDANANVVGNQAFNFIADAAFSAAGDLRFDQSDGVNTIVQGDIDGDGQADFEIELSGLIQLDAGDFLL